MSKHTQLKCQKQAHAYLVLLCVCMVESQGIKTKTLAVSSCSAREQLNWDVANHKILTSNG